MRSEMDWFVELAEMENVSAAADELHLSQPTLSRMLGRLERDLDTTLFDRTGRRLSLNDRGRVYLHHCRRARAEMDAARAAIRDLVDPVEGTVRLAFLHSFGVRLVPELIVGFRHEARVSFTLFQDAAEVVADRVRSDDADLAIVSPRPTGTDLVWAPLMTQRLGLAVPTDHHLADRAEIALAEVASEPFVAMSAGFGMRRILDDLCAAEDVRPDITFETTELGTIAGLVGAGLGVSVMPIEEYGPLAPEVALIPLAGAQTTREIVLVWRRDRPLVGAASRFRDFVVQRGGTST
ncbi:LysR family transcriptional regulator [Williamsia deligens]|uniref:LysR family transcriptional regulator n=1 Tax=Williamsia deligens TaxID=321325 RepID=A0ABW3G427_9NOCA|nr:LysR family transcriptional regulator [Williamsia deligens]